MVKNVSRAQRVEGRHRGRPGDGRRVVELGQVEETRLAVGPSSRKRVGIGKLHNLCLRRAAARRRADPDGLHEPAGLPRSGRARRLQHQLPQQAWPARARDAPQPPDETVRYIPLTQGRFAIVTAADYIVPPAEIPAGLRSKFGRGMLERGKVP